MGLGAIECPLSFLKGQQPVVDPAPRLGRPQTADSDQEQSEDGHGRTRLGDRPHHHRRIPLSLLDQVSKANGFANRFLLVLARHSKLLPFPAKLDAEKAEYFAQRLGDIVNNTILRKQISFHPETAALWIAEYPQLSAEKAGLYGFIVARAEAQVLRLSMIYALLDQMAYIQPVHLRAALAVWRYCETSAKYIFGDALGEPVADDILRALRPNGRDGLTRSEISALFGRNKTSEQISRALTLLVKHGKATMTKRGGGYGRGYRSRFGSLYEFNFVNFVFFVRASTNF